MTLRIQSFILVLITIIFSSCYNYKDLRYMQENDSSLPVYEKEAYKEYKIQVNDEIIFRLISSDETISQLISSTSGSGGQSQISYRVYPDGTIDLPFVDSIKVVGLTFIEATTALEARFKELFPDAIVKLSIMNKTFTMFGNAGSGTFPIYKDKLTIYQALAMSADLAEQIDRKHVRVIRNTDKGTEILEFDIRPKSLIGSKYYYIYPNDIIYIRNVPESFYKVNSFGGVLGVINFSLSLLFTVLTYAGSN